MHEMGSNVARMTMEDNELVSQMNNKATRRHKLAIFRQLMEIFNQKPD